MSARLNDLLAEQPPGLAPVLARRWRIGKMLLAGYGFEDIAVASRGWDGLPRVTEDEARQVYAEIEAMRGDCRDGPVIRLPWPARGLGPNSRAHWAERARLSRRAKADANFAALAAGAKGIGAEASEIKLAVEFRPPVRRKRDIDNLVASLKPAMDGISDALRCDDSIFRPRFALGDPYPGGAVFVTIKGIAHG